jgi:hypothetical protein
MLEALGQDVRGDAGDALLEFREPPRPGQQLLDDEQRPSVADPSDGLGQRRGRFVRCHEAIVRVPAPFIPRHAARALCLPDPSG